MSEHPSSAIVVARENAKLMLMVHRTTDMLYDRRDNPISASEVIRQYKNYLEWEKELPPEMSLPYGIPSTDELDQLTPHVLSLQLGPTFHVHFHMLIYTVSYTTRHIYSSYSPA